jgi:hypothetical protein
MYSITVLNISTPLFLSSNGRGLRGDEMALQQAMGV